MTSNNTGLSAQDLQFQDQVSEAECADVVNKLAEGATRDNLIKVVETSFIFAAHLRGKIAHPESPALACKDKCHWCCHQAVAATPAEIINIVGHIDESFNKKDKKQLISRLEKLDVKSRGLNIAKRAALNMPCAFLVFGRCSIYAARPMGCRRLTSYDEKACKTHGMVESEKATLIAYNGVMQGMEEGLESALPNHQHATLDLTAAALTALKKPEVITQWLNSGQPAFEGCELNQS